MCENKQTRELGATKAPNVNCKLQISFSLAFIELAVAQSQSSISLIDQRDEVQKESTIDEGIEV